MISVCLATYNGESYIVEQLDSILPQLDDNDEIVISDDKSNDSTLELIKSYNDKRIRVYEGPAKGHPRYNFESALNKCNGDYIFLCDQDDRWESNKVSVFKKYLDDYELVVSDCYVIDSHGNTIFESFQGLKRSSQYGFWNNLLQNHYLGCCMAFRRDLLYTILPFPDKIAQHDIWIGLCAEFFNYQIIFLPDKLMAYRRYEGNFSHDSYGYSIKYKFYYRLYIIYNVLRRYFSRKKREKLAN